MKYLFLLSSILMTGFSTYAQCKPYKSFDDSFSGVHYTFYGGRLDIPRSTFVGTTTYVDVYIHKEDSVQYITIRSDIYQREYDVAANPIKMEDNSTFSLRTGDGIMNFETTDISRDKSKMGVNVITITEIHAVITDEQLTTLTQNPIISYRITPEGYSIIQGEVAKKKAERVRLQFMCSRESEG